MSSPPDNPYGPPATDEPSASEVEPWKLRGTVVALLAIYFFETQLFGLFFVAILGGLIMLPTVIVQSRRRREPGRILALKAALVVAMVLAACGTNLGNMALARSRAERVIAACEQFKLATGRYPDQLEELVPRFLASIPSAKLTLSFGGFRYFGDRSEHTLMYTRLPPFGRVFYELEKRRWSQLD